jgi:hypothetical protein
MSNVELIGNYLKLMNDKLKIMSKSKINYE